jgi:glycosyltransferase involved in cell wall biosynthesis
MPSNVERPDLSVVIPAYNEEQRLPATLASIFGFVGQLGLATEVLVADDGSEDATASVVAALTARYPSLRLLRLPHAGKAHAVRSGVLASRGRVVFMCDADLSMPIEDLAKLLAALDAGADIAIGSREAPGAQRFAEPAYRHLMGRVFNRIVRLLTGVPLDDTQCGFKCFRGPVAHILFAGLQRYRAPRGRLRGPMVTGFDVELLFLAHKWGYRVVEVPIHWYYAPGSKVQPIRDTLRMLADVLAVRWHDLRGRYDVPRRAVSVTMRDEC